MKPSILGVYYYAADKDNSQVCKTTVGSTFKQATRMGTAVQNTRGYFLCALVATVRVLQAAEPNHILTQVAY